MNSPAYTPPSAPKARPWKLRGVVRGLLCLFIAVSIAFIPLDFRIVDLDLDDTPALEVQRNEAQALVPVGAGGAAAVAAALGLTETQLACGMAVVLASGAGLYLYYNANSDLSSWPTDQAWPGFKPWDDLTPQEKQNWVGQDGDVGDYWQQQLDLYTMFYGLWDYNSQGNPEPTPEPDDPDEKEKWFTKNNVITALGTGAAVGLGTIASTLVDNAVDSLADMLFGGGVNNNNGLYIPYVNQLTTGNFSYNFAYWSGGIYSYGGYTYSCNAADWYMSNISGSATNFYYYSTSTGYDRTSVVLPGNVVFTADRNLTAAYSTLPPASANGLNQAILLQTSSGNMGYGTGSNTTYYPSTSKLNAAFSGTYVFKDSNGTEMAQFSNGTPSGTYTQAPSYGQFSDTPTAITNNLMSDPTYISNVYNYANTGNDTQKAAQLPTVFSGVDGAPTYADFVKTTPNEDVTPIPDDGPLPTPDPGPGPGPGPDNPTEYEDDFSDKVRELLSQPFDQLFPFCLIGDLRVFTEKVNSAFNGGGNTRSEPNYDELVIPLEQFNVDGLEDITFDLVPLKGMGAIIKPWINALLVVALLIGSFRFFLNRGGE